MLYDLINATTVKQVLGLADDDRIDIDIDWDASRFRDSWCDVTGEPAAVHVTYYWYDESIDETITIHAAYSWDIAVRDLAFVLNDSGVPDDQTIEVYVNGWCLAYAVKAVAA